MSMNVEFLSATEATDIFNRIRKHILYFATLLQPTAVQNWSFRHEQHDCIQFEQL